VAGVTGAHPEIGPELRLLAQSILDRLDPAVRMLAARATSGPEGACQQVWCPVCALAATVSGEQHPMLTVIAEHSVALLGVVRAMTEAMDASAEPTTSAPEPDRDPPSPGPGRYQHIPVTVEE